MNDTPKPRCLCGHERVDHGLFLPFLTVPWFTWCKAHGCGCSYYRTTPEAPENLNS